jgi:hypothetical protein
VRNLTLLTVLAIIGVGSVMMTGCSKGNTGPAGPAGPDSVQYSGWNTLAMNFNATDSAYEETVQASGITSAVLNQGSVMGFLLVPDPSTGDSSVINADVAMVQYFAVGHILLQSEVDYTSNLYRYVIVPSKISTTDVSGTLHTYTASQMKQMTYSDLTKILAIPAKGSSAAQFSSGHQ